LAAFWIVLFCLIIVILFYQNASAVVFAIAIAAYLFVHSFFSGTGWLGSSVLWLAYLIIFIPLLLKPFRLNFLTRPLFLFFKKIKPDMSQTEREALCSGDVGWTAEIFGARPDWDAFAAIKLSTLSAEEQAFIAGPVETLCAMIDNWEINRSMSIPDAIWSYIKQEHFLAMIIPKDQGGLDFSATAIGLILSKIASLSVAVGSSIAVPNSLGPAELLVEYGTQQQKDYFLPRLAKGEDIPCFALTSPTAGSDAGSIEDHGVVVEAEFEGKQQLCLRLNWNKRYITLAPIATLLGLAFKLYDPDHLLGSEEYIGITCALIPTKTPGVVTGRRHFPLNCAFTNGPTQGNNVIIPIDWIIGGREKAGKGWRMLMECLAAGRAITLPASAGGGSASQLLPTTAYARIRRQFNLPIGHFGGVQESLIKLIGYTYAIQATRLFTAAIIDGGKRPVVGSAITKCYTTNYAREVITACMDINGGKAICMGPSNYAAQNHFETPISITVEGANILTRSMIIFGQGSIRCHPYVMEELFSVDEQDAKVGLKRFDKAVWAHIGFGLSNIVRSLVLGLTNAFFVRVPKGPLKRYYQLVTRFSTVVALVVDVSMLMLGGKLKRLECLSGRLADLVSFLYIIGSVLKYHQTGVDGKVVAEEVPLVKWVCLDLLYKFQQQLHEFLLNFPNRMVARILRVMVMPLGRFLRPPSDNLMKEVCNLMLSPNPARNRFKQFVAGIDAEDSLLGGIEKVFEKVIAVRPIEKRVLSAEKTGIIVGKTFFELIDAAVLKKIITADEKTELLAMHEARMTVVNVDDFSNDEVVRNKKGTENGTHLV
jgi:acyl-CoA dehydrogenase